jgi:thiol-disulfide isomerase/thioredoxin
MKKLLLFALAFCSASAHAVAQSTTAPTPAATPKVTVTVGKPIAPAVRVEPFRVVPDEIFNAELKDLDGASFFLSNYRGRVFVVNIWATWCGPCRMEIPELNKIYKDYSPRGVEFVGLTTESPLTDAARVQDFVRAFGIKYKLGWADGETAKALLAGHYSIPQTLVIAADGRVVSRFRGYAESIPPMLRRSIEMALNPGLQPLPAPPAPRPAPPAPDKTPEPSAPSSAVPAPETLPAPGA